MLRLLLVIWAMAATTLAGIFVLIVLTVPALAAKDMVMILPAALLGAVVAAPISYLVTRKILGMTASK